MTNHDDLMDGDDANAKLGCALALAMAGFTFSMVALVLALIAVFR